MDMRTFIDILLSRQGNYEYRYCIVQYIIYVHVDEMEVWLHLGKIQ